MGTFGGSQRGGSKGPFHSQEIGKDIMEERWGPSGSCHEVVNTLVPHMKVHSMQPTHPPAKESEAECQTQVSLLLLPSLPPGLHLLQVQLGEETCCLESLGIRTCCLTFLLTHSWWLACLSGNFLPCTNIWLTFQGLLRGLGESDFSEWNLHLLLLHTPGCDRPGSTRKLVLNLGVFLIMW